MNKKSGLGKGLGALIPGFSGEKSPARAENYTQKAVFSTENGGKTPETVDKSKQVFELPISKVEPRARQPRTVFDEGSLEELAQSIREHGVLQPILVRQVDNHYEIVAGERRWRAAKKAGLLKVPVLIRDYGDQKLAEVSLIENLQREDLNPIEEAKALRELAEGFHLTQEQLAEKIGKSRAAIANSLRLLKLDESVQALVMDGALSEGHARTLLALPEASLQREAARKVTEEHLSVRETEALVKRLLEPAPVRQTAAWREKDQSAYDLLQEDLQKHLGTKVQIHRTKPHKGQLIIDYYSVEELENIAAILQRKG